MSEETHLPVLESLVSCFQSENSLQLEDIVFVGVQHLLPTTINLFSSLISLGALPSNIFLIGKQYSACFSVVEKLIDFGIQVQNITPLASLGEYEQVFNNDLAEMWRNIGNHVENNKCRAIIVLDDGGKCLEFIVQNVPTELPLIGIEQTTSGVFNAQLLERYIAFVDVALSAAKKHLEAKLIAEETLQKLRSGPILNQKNSSFGIIGVGTIGEAVARELLLLGHEVFLYDNLPKKIKGFKKANWCDSIEKLFIKADYIFGCTGKDVTVSLNILNIIKNDKCLISCSSGDKEFSTLIKTIKHINKLACNPLEDIICKLDSGVSIKILNGGFPINFDRQNEFSHPYDIQLTRGLLLAALIQAVIMLPEITSKKINKRFMLHPGMQRFIFNNWINRKVNLHNKMINKFQDVSWILDHSHGTYYTSSQLQSFL